MTPDTPKTFWLEFNDHGLPLGAAIIDVSVEEAADVYVLLQETSPRAKPGAEWLAAAVKKAWQRGCNPGGQVYGVEVTGRIPDDAPHDQLMQERELRAAGLIE